MRERVAARPGRDDRERLRLRRLRGPRAPARRDRFRITHAGSFFGKRDPRPFLTALKRPGSTTSSSRFLGDFRSADREWAETRELGDRLELIPYAPRRRVARAAARLGGAAAADPRGGRPRQGRALSGKVFEYLAAERPILAVVPPDGAAAELIRDDGRRASSSRPTTSTGWPRALRDLHARWRAGTLDGAPLSDGVAAQGVAPDAGRGARATCSRRASR